jgi:hypothetical protein
MRAAHAAALNLSSRHARAQRVETVALRREIGSPLEIGDRSDDRFRDRREAGSRSVIDRMTDLFDGSRSSGACRSEPGGGFAGGCRRSMHVRAHMRWSRWCSPAELRNRRRSFSLVVDLRGGDRDDAREGQQEKRSPRLTAIRPTARSRLRGGRFGVRDGARTGVVACVFAFCVLR